MVLVEHEATVLVEILFFFCSGLGRPSVRNVSVGPSEFFLSFDRGRGPPFRPKPGPGLDQMLPRRRPPTSVPKIIRSCISANFLGKPLTIGLRS